MSTTGLPRIYTVPELAEYFGCDESTVYRRIRSGELRAFTIGRKKGIRVREDAVLEYTAAGGVQ